MAEGSGIRVVLCDDHALVRQGFRRILEDEPGITVVAEGGNGAQAIELAKTHKPDVVVLDMRLAAHPPDAPDPTTMASYSCGFA